MLEFRYDTQLLIEGENLDILIGSRPLAKTEGEEEEKALNKTKRGR